jgi:oligopeptide transport system substrate-binding protein
VRAPRRAFRFSAAHARPPLLAVSLALLGAAGCSPRAGTRYFGTTRPAHPPDVLWINNASEPEYIDPNKCSDSVGGVLTRNLFAGLAQNHPQDLEPMPDVARRWDISEDRKRYTFHLRESTWSDGTPLLARDFEWSWKRLLDPETASKYGSLLYVLENGRPFNQGALWVGGIDWLAGAEEETARRLADYVEEGVPVDHVELAEWPERGAFVYLTGGADELPGLRRKAVETLDGRPAPPFAALGASPGKLSVRVADSSLVGVRALDDLTLEARLAGPVPYFTALVTHYPLLPVPRHVIEGLEKKGIDPALWTRPEHIVSNGAFVLAAHHFRYFYDLEKNPRYWDAASVRINEIHVPMVESYNTTLNLYRGGEFDWIGSNASLPSEFMNHLERFDDFARAPYGSVYFYWINTKAPPLDNPKLRRALSLAIDRQSLVDNVARAEQTPSADLVPDGLAGYQGLHTPLFDPEEARAMLKEAGYASGAEVPPITLIYNTSEGHRQLAEAIQEMWKEHLGVYVAIENQEWQVYLKNQQLHNFQIARMGWIMDYADPFTFLELLSEHNGNNHSNWHTPEYDRLLREGNNNPDPAARLAIFREAEAMVRDAAPMLPLYLYTKSTMMKPYLMGYWGNDLDQHPWKWFWIDERWYDGVPAERLPNTPPPHIPFS